MRKTLLILLMLGATATAQAEITADNYQEECEKVFNIRYYLPVLEYHYCENGDLEACDYIANDCDECITEADTLKPEFSKCDEMNYFID